MAAGQCCLDPLVGLDGGNGPCKQEEDSSKWLLPFPEGAFWLLCTPTLTVRGEAEPTFQLPSESYGRSSGSDRDRGMLW